MPSSAHLIGKPLTLFIGDDKRQIGTITAAVVNQDGLLLKAVITDEEAKRVLGIEAPSDVA